MVFRLGAQNTLLHTECLQDFAITER